ncbi:hypothetical protein [Paenibacillus residui]|uniref:Lipoprotein n=1 Tax=Paenibacillus residui TaxID=629724 RepID=A0ABW3D5L9_9BACL
MGHILILWCLAAMLASCSNWATPEPEALLDNVLANMEGLAGLAYEGRSEVQIAGMSVAVSTFSQSADGSGRLAVNAQGGGRALDPVDLIDGLGKARKNVRLEMATGRRPALVVETDAEQWTRLIRQQWEKRLAEIIEQQAGRSAQYRQVIGVEKAAQLDKEIAGRIQEEKARLEQLSSSLSAQGNCRIWIDLPSQRAKELEVKTRLNYSAQGAGQEETVRSHYIFSTPLD